jgi:hypothetical protein
MNNEQSTDKTRPNIGAGTPISINEARERIQLFRDKILDLPDYPDDTSKTVACLIKMEDLQMLLKETGVDGIRCYLSLRRDAQLGGQYCISFVMVATSYNRETGNYDDIIDETGSSDVFDFTAPCPNSCSPNSLLARADSA